MDNIWQDNSVSVIIPTYSRVNLTVNAVHSALNQTLRPSQVIVVDDGSSEEDFSNLASQLMNLPVRLIKGEKSGHPGRARNVGIALATSKWIAFLDSDDLWRRDKLEIQMNYARHQGAQAICSNAVISNGDTLGSNLCVSPLQIIRTKQLVKHNYIVNSSVLVTRELLLRVGGVSAEYSVRGVEDYSTWLKISRFENWHCIDEPLVVYAQNSEDSLSIGVYSNYYSRVNAWLDFASWEKENFKESQIVTRILIKFLSSSIGKKL